MRSCTVDEYDESPVGVDAGGARLECRAVRGRNDHLGPDRGARVAVFAGQPGRLGVAAGVLPLQVPTAECFEDRGEQSRAVGGRRALIGQRRRGVERQFVSGGRHVQPDADDDVGTGNLGEDADRLAPSRTDEHIVGPFQHGVDAGRFGDCLAHGEAGEQRQPTPRRDRHIRPKQHGEREAGSRRRGPRPVQPPAPCALVLGDENRAGRVNRSRAEQVRVRRFSRVDDVDLRPGRADRPVQTAAVKRRTLPAGHRASVEVQGGAMQRNVSSQ